MISSTARQKHTSHQFVAAAVITTKKDGTVKIARDAKPMNSQIHKFEFQLPKLSEFPEFAAQIITSNQKTQFGLNFQT